MGNILRDTPLEKAVSFSQQLSVVDHFLVWDGSRVYFPLSSPVHAATVSVSSLVHPVVYEDTISLESFITSGPYKDYCY